MMRNDRIEMAMVVNAARINRRTMKLTICSCPARGYQPRTLGKGASGADRFFAAPADELAGVLDLGKSRTRSTPQVRPHAPVGDLTCRVLTTASHETGEGRPACRLSDGLIAQVEAPADSIAGIG